MSFIAFPKMPRLNREVIITEKIDGTNGQVAIFTGPEMAFNQQVPEPEWLLAKHPTSDLYMFAGSRNKWIRPGKQTDNAGFAKWVQDHADDLWGLGPGRHYGEWWGSGIQRGYGLPAGERRFSLFNVSRWKDERPTCCSSVPVLYEGPFSTEVVNTQLERLRTLGSLAAPFMNPEGLIVYHTAAQRSTRRRANQRPGFCKPSMCSASLI